MGPKKLTDRITPEQLEYLVNFMELNPKLNSGVLSQQFSKSDRKKLWQELTNTLNSAGGLIKTPELWRKTWNDKKSYVKAKAARVNTSARGTGGGEGSGELLTQLEERILNVTRWVSAVGDSSIKEIGVPSQILPNMEEDIIWEQEIGGEEEIEDDYEDESDSNPASHSSKKSPHMQQLVSTPSTGSFEPPRKKRLTLTEKTELVLEELKDQSKTQHRILETLVQMSGSLQKISESLVIVADSSQKFVNDNN